MNSDNNQPNKSRIISKEGSGRGFDASLLRCVILDFDGTLGDTRSLIVKTMQQTIAELGLPGRTDEECAAMIGLPLKQTFTDLIPMTDEMGDRCTALYRRLFDINNKPGSVPMFPYVEETLAELTRRGLIVTIASSRLGDTLHAFVRDMGLDRYVRYIVSVGDVEHAKPAPDMVIKTLGKYDLRPEEAIVVGDTVFDILMAHNAGVAAVGVTYGNGTREDMKSVAAEYIIDDFGELTEIIS